MNGQVLHNWLRRIIPGQTFHQFPLESWSRICNALEGLRGEGGITVTKDSDGRNWTISLNSRTGKGGSDGENPEDESSHSEVILVGGNKIDVTRAGDTWTISYNENKDEGGGGGGGGGDDEPEVEPPPCGNPLNGPENDPTPEPEDHTAIEDSDPPLDESADPTPGDGGKTDNPLDHPGDGGYTPACGGEPT